MNITEYLRDSSGRSIALIEESATRITLKSVGGSTIGYYDKVLGATYRVGGTLVSRNNILTSLL